ncbi:hypothetical protein P280DRAFT_485093 [Massarina eburnea CBS 473.64]|uniref:Zn(2)-C6 fungal-type domain-containing protein n=1 Tax=Massarina eburnea CBS 473.64 TaxID=1395130 RepID=A0A6A6RLC5_9PLEO|nr:hypothetical protein P280DRAFT_485093 [Massarina eburnea CBS 473.64]
MVSRGGRSKRCSNCNEKRPSCDRCRKRGLQCDGPKDLTWIVNQNNPFPPHKNSIPYDLSLVAFHDDLCLAYTRTHLLRGGNIELAYDKIQCLAGTSTDPLSPGITLLRNAIISLATTFFGTHNRQTAITNRGYREYGDVLKELNWNLTQTHLQTSNETILTILTCTLLEIFLPTGPNHFLKHAGGVEAILRQRGPPAESEGEGRKIVYNLRTLSIIGALAERRSSIWASDGWRDLPPLQTEVEFVLRHDIFKILATCTVLISEYDQLSQPQAPSEYSPLLARAYTCLETLQATYPRWEAYNQSFLDSSTLTAETEMSQDVKIANAASATNFLLYNSAYICILGIVHTMNPSEKYTSLRINAAIRIMRCLERKGYETRMGGPETNTIGFVATKAAWEILGGFNTPEGRRLAKFAKSSPNGTFAVGAWEHSDDQSKRQYPKVPDKMKGVYWNAPLWSERKAKGDGADNELALREIIDIGQRGEKKDSSPDPLARTFNLTGLDGGVFEKKNFPGMGVLGSLPERVGKFEGFEGAGGIRRAQAMQRFGVPPEIRERLREETNSEEESASLQRQIQTSIYAQPIAQKPWM